MTSDFTMGVQRTAGRVVISREGFSGWKGTFPPSLGGGSERFVDMNSYNHRVYRWDVYWNRRAGAVKLGEAAHIRAARPGARFDERMTMTSALILTMEFGFAQVATL